MAAGTIGSRQDAVDYLTWTFYFRRLLQNPSYYGLADTDEEDINAFLSGLVEDNLAALEVRVGVLPQTPCTRCATAAVWYLQSSSCHIEQLCSAVTMHIIKLQRPAFTFGIDGAQDAGCVSTAEEGDVVAATPMGHIASFFYLKYTTMAFFRQHMGPGMDLKVRPAPSPCSSKTLTSLPAVCFFWVKTVLSVLSRIRTPSDVWS